MKAIIKSLKASQKLLAKSIRDKKDQRKSHKDGFVLGLAQQRHTYRINHIIYCILRGKTMGQIESRRVTHTPTDYSECCLRFDVKKTWKQILPEIEFPEQIFTEVGYAFVRPCAD